jgi:cell division septation protein DedD
MADVDFDDLDGPYSGRFLAAAAGAGRLQAWVRLSGGVASLALVVGFAVWGYRLAVRDVTGVPVVRAMEGPMRVAPADPGGEIADHQGLAVNGVAAVGTAAPVPDRLILAPRPVDLADEDVAGLSGLPLSDLTDVAAPLPSPGTGGVDLSLAAAPIRESASPTEIAVDAALAEALGLTDGETEPEAVAAGAEADDPTDIAPADAILVSPRPRARPAAATAEPEPRAATPLPEIVEMDPAVIPSGTRLVQFGSFDTVEEARTGWALLQGRFGDLMAEKAMVLQPAEGNGRTFWRLRAHGFEDDAETRRFCLAFVAQEATCIPVRHR